LTPSVLIPGEEDGPVRIRGAYTINGAPPGFSYVEIWIRQWPYGADRRVYLNGTSDGTFTHEIGAAVNTLVYARTDIDPDPNATEWVTSPLYKIVVYPEFLDFNVDVVKPYVIRMDFAYDFPDAFSFPLEGRRIHWYMIRRKGKRRTVRQIARSKTRIVGGNVLRGRTRARLPRGRYKFGVGFCIDLPLGVDTGLGEPAEVPCP
jgi:hypothetical protein